MRSFFSTFAKPKITKNDNGRKVIVIIPRITLPERLQDKVMTDQGATTSSLPAKRQLEFVIRLKKENYAKFSKLFSVYYRSVKEIVVEVVCGFDDEEYEVCCCF